MLPPCLLVSAGCADGQKQPICSKGHPVAGKSGRAICQKVVLPERCKPLAACQQRLKALIPMLCRTPLVEELLIVLHSIAMSANTKQALSARSHFMTPAATALHTPSTIHNQLVQQQDGANQQTSPSRQQSRHVYSHAKREGTSHATPSSTVPTPLSRSALQNVERGTSGSSLKRQLPSHRSLPASQTPDQQSLPSPSQTEYRNPVYGQVRDVCTSAYPAAQSVYWLEFSAVVCSGQHACLSA